MRRSSLGRVTRATEKKNLNVYQVSGVFTGNVEVKYLDTSHYLGAGVQRSMPLPAPTSLSPVGLTPQAFARLIRKNYSTRSRNECWALDTPVSFSSVQLLDNGVFAIYPIPLGWIGLEKHTYYFEL